MYLIILISTEIFVQMYGIYSWGDGRRLLGGSGRRMPKVAIVCAIPTMHGWHSSFHRHTYSFWAFSHWHTSSSRWRKASNSISNCYSLENVPLKDWELDEEDPLRSQLQPAPRPWNYWPFCHPTPSISNCRDTSGSDINCSSGVSSCY